MMMGWNRCTRRRRFRTTLRQTETDIAQKDDQDDVCIAGKPLVFLTVFMSRPQIYLISSRYLTADRSDTKILSLLFTS